MVRNKSRFLFVVVNIHDFKHDFHFSEAKSPKLSILLVPVSVLVLFLAQ